MPVFELVTLLIVLCAALAYINHRLLRLPGVIGLLVLSLGMAILVVTVNHVFGLKMSEMLERELVQVDFSKALLEIMLCFMLFAGSYHSNSEAIWKEAKSIGILAVAGTVLMTGLVAFLFYGAATWVGLPFSFWHCLLFGALIAPTDPIAVLGILNKTKVEERVKTMVIGESLFNDGVGIVLFLAISESLVNGPDSFSAGNMGWLFLQEGVGGLTFGLALGYAMYRLILRIDDYEVAILLTLAAVMGGYLMAQWLHISGPLAMVVAGLVTGSARVRQKSMNADMELYLDKFWEMVDMVLNAILFLLIGLHFLGLNYNFQVFLLGFLVVGIVLAGRFAIVKLLSMLFRRSVDLNNQEQILITWSGLKGGLSLAMALSITDTAVREPFVLITYVMVVFSIIAQGLSIGWLAKRFGL
jgi:CPA1 family monovalent cation:H+ antiporter